MDTKKDRSEERGRERFISMNWSLFLFFSFLSHQILTDTPNCVWIFSLVNEKKKLSRKKFSLLMVSIPCSVFQPSILIISSSADDSSLPRHCVFVLLLVLSFVHWMCTVHIYMLTTTIVYSFRVCTTTIIFTFITLPFFSSSFFIYFPLHSLLLNMCVYCVCPQYMLVLRLCAFLHSNREMKSEWSRVHKNINFRNLYAVFR